MYIYIYDRQEVGILWGLAFGVQRIACRAERLGHRILENRTDKKMENPYVLMWRIRICRSLKL